MWYKKPSFLSISKQAQPSLELQMQQGGTEISVELDSFLCASPSLWLNFPSRLSLLAS